MPSRWSIFSLVLALGPCAPELRAGEPLQPLPDRGAVPPIVGPPAAAAREIDARRERAEAIRKQVRRIRYEHFGDIRHEPTRRAGIDKLLAISDPAGLAPMAEELAEERQDVREALFDHLAALGAEGQAALALAAVHYESEAARGEAIRRMTVPASEPVLRVLDEGLRSNVHAVANSAGTLAGALRATETIPLLIFAQATADPVGSESGDIAWIAIATQRAFVAGIQPVVGDGAGAFQPIPGVIQEGAILRVVDAVAIFYRTEVHRALVSITSDDWGRSTAHLGYDMRAWWAWYNTEYVAFRNERLREEQLAEQIRRDRERRP